MIIDEDLLLKYGGKIKHYQPKEILWLQGARARNFYQVKKGGVQVTTTDEEGKQFIHAVFTVGECFGEPSLFDNIPYRGSGITIGKTDLIVQSKDQFMKMLEENHSLYMILLKRLSQRLHYNGIISQIISNEQAEDRIVILIDLLKEKEGKDPEEIYKVPLTRQQIADLIGLRVETVIRAIQELKKRGELNVKRGKIYR